VPVPPVPHGAPPVRTIAVIMARKPSDTLCSRIECLLGAGLDAHLVIDCGVGDDVSTARIADRVHFIPDADLTAAGFTDLQSKTCGKKLTAWERALLWCSKLAAERALGYVWIIEDDVRWDDVSSLVALIDGYAADAADLVAQRIADSQASRPHWPHWGTMHGLLPAASGLCATFNVISRLSARLLAEIAAFGAAKRRLGFHEAFLPSLAHQRGLRISFYHDPHEGLAALPPPRGLPSMLLRFRPPVTDAELARHEANIYHPIKNSAVGVGLLDV
jgi:hypothetical protein